jgi:predicted dehydrogenase
MDRVKVGVIGVGTIGIVHATALRKPGRCQVCQLGLGCAPCRPRTGLVSRDVARTVRLPDPAVGRACPM